MHTANYRLGDSQTNNLCATFQVMLNLGEAGPITTKPLRKTDAGWEVLPDGRRKPDAWQARCRVVDWEGKTHDKRVRAKTKREAEAALTQAVREVLASSDSTLRSDTPLTEACEAWLKDGERKDSGRRASTMREYRGTYGRTVAADGSSLRRLTIIQANDVQRLTKFLRAVADTRGDSAVRQTKAILNGTLNHAVACGVLPHNAMRDVSTVRAQVERASTTERDTSRAFTKAERDALVVALDAWAAEPHRVDVTKGRKAVADLIAFLSASGLRIGEALRLRWEDVDLDAGTFQIKEGKTPRARRSLNLPGWATERLRRLHAETGGAGYVFSAPGRLSAEVAWDTSNANSAVTRALNANGHPWARSHTFRKTVAVILDAAGVPLTDIAAQLGHADPAFTARTYLGWDPSGDKSATAAHL